MKNSVEWHPNKRPGLDNEAPPRACEIDVNSVDGDSVRRVEVVVAAADFAVRELKKVAEREFLVQYF